MPSPTKHQQHNEPLIKEDTLFARFFYIAPTTLLRVILNMLISVIPAPINISAVMTVLMHHIVLQSHFVNKEDIKFNDDEGTLIVDDLSGIHAALKGPMRAHIASFGEESTSTINNTQIISISSFSSHAQGYLGATVKYLYGENVNTQYFSYDSTNPDQTYQAAKSPSIQPITLTRIIQMSGLQEMINKLISSHNRLNDNKINNSTILAISLIFGLIASIAALLPVTLLGIQVFAVIATTTQLAYTLICGLSLKELKALHESNNANSPSHMQYIAQLTLEVTAHTLKLLTLATGYGSIALYAATWIVQATSTLMLYSLAGNALLQSYDLKKLSDNILNRFVDDEAINTLLKTKCGEWIGKAKDYAKQTITTAKEQTQNLFKQVPGMRG